MQEKQFDICVRNWKNRNAFQAYRFNFEGRNLRSDL